MCLAVPGQIISISDNDPLNRSGKVSFGGTHREINLACVPEAKVGDYILAHVGMAISVIDPKEADQIFEYLRRINNQDE
jgi:hydrogenase expression/formation protein HypC